MKLLKYFFVCSLIVMAGMHPSFGAKGWVLGPTGYCAVNDTGANHADEFYYCGDQDKDCAGVTDNSSDRRYWLSHGDSTGAKDNRNYWCCLSGGMQKLVEGNNWIVSEETKSEVRDDGIPCTWVRKTNICGLVNNEQDNCKYIKCDAGYVMTDQGACAAPCGEGQGYLNGVCVSCENTERQGLVGSRCIRCELDEFFSKTKLSCVKYSSMTRVPTGAHNECWLCPTPGTLYACLKDVADNGRLTDNELKQACSLDNKDSDLSQWKLPL